MPEAEKHTEPLTVRFPPTLAGAVNDAATARGMSPSEWLRQAARVALTLDGIDPATGREAA